MKKRLEAVQAALTAAGEPATVGSELVSTYDLVQGPMALRTFYERALAGGLTTVYSEAWPTDALEIGGGTVFHESGDHSDNGVFEAKNALALASLRNGSLYLTIATENRDDVDVVLAQFRTRFPFAATPVDGLIPVTFWSYGMFGPQSFSRRVEVQSWEEISSNYTSSVRDELAGMMSGFEPSKGGQLLLWQGPPGTGKTWALRALASEWRSWADVHYISDPDAFFGEHADYMVEVLLRESYNYDVAEGEEPVEKWRLLVLEDTGELLSADAKAKSGQALSRLLNVVDGLIGQGLRVLVLLTTNDEIETFHPAVTRPGRCAVQIEFSPLSPDEVAEWTGKDAAESPATLAELYASKGEARDPSLTSAGGEMKPQAVTIEPETAATDLGIPTPSDVRPAGNGEGEAQVETPAPKTNGGQIRWEGILVVEDTLTEDGRYIKPGATSWRELPLSLAAMLETDDGHKGAVVCGRIDEIFREGNLIMGRGVFDDSEFGHEIARMVDDRVLRGNSVDFAVKEFELAPASDFDENGHRVRESDTDVDPMEMLLGPEEPMVFVFLDCVIGMSTLCPFPAFADANVSVLASALAWRATRQANFTLLASAPKEEPAETPVEPVLPAAVPAEEEGLTASAAGLAPLKPPTEWFADPQFEELTALTVTDDGRVYGHFAQWDTCHIGIPDVCTTAPSSAANYAYFHLGEIETEEGERVSCGKITLGTGHAAKHLGRQAATEHYDHTGAVVADVVAGEDAFGPWIVGAVRPDVSANRVRELRAATLSGDWRGVNGNLELVGLLAVNVPGFPVPRGERALVAATESGLRVESLVAAGLVERPEWSQADLGRLERLAVVAEGGLEALAARVA